MERVFRTIMTFCLAALGISPWGVMVHVRGGEGFLPPRTVMRSLGFRNRQAHQVPLEPLYLHDREWMPPLAEAVLAGDLSALCALLAAGADPDETSSHNGATALFHAARLGDARMIAALAHYGADMDKATIAVKPGWILGGSPRLLQSGLSLTPLMIAMGTKDITVIRLLLALGAEPNHVTESVVEARTFRPSDIETRRIRRSALHIAIEISDTGSLENNLDIVRLLLRAGADVNVRDEWERTPLHFLLDRGERHRELGKLLLAHGADVNAVAGRRMTPVLATLPMQTHGYLSHPVISGRGETPLRTALLAGQNDLLELLIAHGADPDLAGASRMQPDELSIFQTLDGEERARSRKAWMLLDEAWHPVSRTILLWNGAAEHTQLGRAAWKNDAGEAARCLASGDDVDERGPYGLTALMYAAMAGDPGLLRLLLDAGADPGIRDEAGCSALFHAAALDRIDAMHVLLTHGAAEYTREELSTILMSLASEDRADAVRVLLEHGADGNLVSEVRDRSPKTPRELRKDELLRNQDVIQRSPLEHAVAHGRREMARTLLQHGAEVEGREGRTPLDIAMDRGDLRAAELLFAHGADAGKIEDATRDYGLMVRGGKEILALFLKHGGRIGCGKRFLNPAVRAMFHNPGMRDTLARHLRESCSGEERATFLHHAVNSLHVFDHRVLAMLLDGMDPEFLQEGDYGTAMHQAAGMNNHIAMDMLARQGADLNPRTKEGNTPLDYARDINMGRAAAWLEERGAVSGRGKEENQSL